MPRVRENHRILREAHQAVAKASQAGHPIPPAGEWLLDNFQVIEDQVAAIATGLTDACCHELPKLAAGFLAGYPRAYALAWDFVAAADSEFSPEGLTCFARAYQETKPLALRELWAVPALLSAVLLENLRRLALRALRVQAGILQADADFKRAQRDGAPLPELPADDTARRAYAAQIARRLHGPLPGQPPNLDRLDAWLDELGIELAELVQQEHIAQIADHQSVRHIINGMSTIAAFSWPRFVEDAGLIDDALRAHPGYGALDFETRDRYRHAVENLAKQSGRTEPEVAKLVIGEVRRAEADPAADPRRREPGHYLIGPGRYAFERAIGFKPSPKQKLMRAVVARAWPLYLGGMAVLTLAVLAVPMGIAAESGLSAAALLLLAVLGAFPASDIAMGLLNRLVSAGLPPCHLPRLDLKDGVPPELRTCVAVPTMFTSEAGVRQQLRQLEVHYLANRDGEVYFALLSDWADADQETLPDDARLLNIALDGIAALNARYGAGRFCVCHRRRLWNPGEKQWMGWERKRGKLHEFNRLLRGAEDTSFLPEGGRPPPGVRYVLTLDADTHLPIGAVAQLAGVAAHPLNRPVLDPAGRRVVQGYAIFQPRVTATLPPRRENSAYHRIFAGQCGMDAYSDTVSEVYQDLFGLGTYSGKGLYDVDAFEAALAGRVPENTLLSHDLFESVFARCALVSDIELFEEFPAHAGVASARQHRWARGDWQLLPWILGVRELPMPGRWKMLDNLRRSLSAPGACLGLVAAWAIPGAPAGAMAGLVLTAVGLPAVLAAVDGLGAPPSGISLTAHARTAGSNVLRALAASFASLGFLAHHAGLMLDAIVRTLVRLYLTRRRLLIWVTASQAKEAANHALGHYLRPMARSAGLMAGTGTVLGLANPSGLAAAAPFLLLWGLSPLLAWALSLPEPHDPAEDLPPAEAGRLRLVARRTWRFFEEFVTAEDNHLPPDNFQEDPHPTVSHRSSPTNFGLYLLSVLSARDFGWLGLTDTVERLEASLRSLCALPRLRGHFYNWYDTEKLCTLEPRFVSTVDSGNLAGHLLALAEACREILDRPLDFTAAQAGLGDNHRLFMAALADSLGPSAKSEALLAQGRAIGDLLDHPPEAEHTARWWQDLADHIEHLPQKARAQDGTGSELLAWAAALREGLRSHRRDLDSLAPWLSWPASSPAHRLRETRLRDLPGACASLLDGLSGPQARTLRQAGHRAATLVGRLDALANTAERLFHDMDFGFLYDPERRMFSLGYRVGEGELDNSYYDLLASEARLASLIAIAKREVPVAHWFHLSRRMVRASPGSVLLSWSGSMFEYLMPSLVSFTPRHSLLDQTCRRAIHRQAEYGQEQGVPWGVSESAFSARDPDFTYQYSAFGVPDLGMKRGLADDLVIAPYATALAAMYAPKAAAENYARLEGMGALGRHGFYEALDFTPARLAEGQRANLVRCYMAHHQGMSLAALANALHGGILRRRFHAAPLIRATELLLQERIPQGIEVKNPAFLSPLYEAEAAKEAREAQQLPLQPALAVDCPAHLYSNGRYTVLLTAAGSGYSEWEGLAVTRWRPDAALDGLGTHIYLRDVETGRAWSAGYQPTAARPERYEAVFLEDRARIVRADGGLATALEVVVSPEDPAELRRLSLTNHGNRAVEVEATSCAELALAPMRSDAAHPAFAKLFVETEFVASCGALLAHRRAGPGGPEMWAAHLLAGGGEAAQFETDRARFVGRGRSLRAPLAVEGGGPLGCSAGPVLDPVFSLRARLKVAPGATAHATFVTLAGPTRAAVLALAEKYRGAGLFERASALACTQAQVQLKHLGTGPDEARLFQALAARLLYPVPEGRPGQKAVKPATPALWRLGLSGERPLALLRVASAEDRPLVEQLLRAHEYWRSKRLEADLVVLCEEGASHAGELWNLVEGLLRARRAARPGQGGGVLALRADLLDEDERALLRSAARVSLVGGSGTLAEQMAGLEQVWKAGPAGNSAGQASRALGEGRRAE